MMFMHTTAKQLLALDTGTSDVGSRRQEAALLEAFHVIDLAGQAAMLQRPDGSILFISRSARELVEFRIQEICSAVRDWMDDKISVRHPGARRRVLRLAGDATSTIRITVGVIGEMVEPVAIVTFFALEPRVAVREQSSPSDRLTLREKEIAHLIASGRTNQEIADELGIALHTVRRHSERIFKKFGVHTRAKLICELRR